MSSECIDEVHFIENPSQIYPTKNTKGVYLREIIKEPYLIEGGLSSWKYKGFYPIENIKKVNSTESIREGVKITRITLQQNNKEDYIHGTILAGYEAINENVITES